eukprot:Phypoly_transcript_04541.p2 GENE.Phypoly_transcript_04541~~Phypoly_transcript_04541.p2  ORF type:complete len:201 (+),score=66.69 Phypoly_transcript_04541:1529-2131(+)
MLRQAESLKSDNTRLQSQKPGGASSKGNAEADSLRQQLEKEKRSHQDQLDKEKRSHQDQLDKEKRSHLDQLEKEKKSHQDALNKLKKELDAKSDELDKLKKQSKASGKAGWTAASPTSPPSSPPAPSSPPTPSLDQTVEDLKHHLFTWLTLALKFDRMAMRKLCNINSSVLYEKITDQKIHYADWPDFIRAEMDKCTIDM